MRRPASTRLLAVLSAVTVAASGGALVAARATPPPAGPSSGPTPDLACDTGSMPESTQGRAPLADYTSGRAAAGYFCNAREIGHIGGTIGGYRVERYVDAAGHECAYWDSTLLFPNNLSDQAGVNGQTTVAGQTVPAATPEGPGTYVTDMSDPANPVVTDVLRTPAFQSPHESVRLNQARGLLVADMGNPGFDPGFVDVYDVKTDCRHPKLDASVPMGVLGHEGGFSPDGNTFWVSSLYGHTLAAVDLTNPTTPRLLGVWFNFQPHGVSISDDGTRLYMAEGQFNSSEPGGGFTGLTILDVSQVQNRVLNPQVSIVSRLTWSNVSTPQNATPFTVAGHHYLLEDDEFGSGASIGAARIIDIEDETNPFVVSNMRLAVNEPSAQGADLEADPGNGADQPFQGYQAHYCTLPSRVDPYVIACSFIMSGLRVFDIRDVANPVEIAYFNKPLLPSQTSPRSGAFAMSAPAYDEATDDIWYSDGNSGFYVVRLDSAATGITNFAGQIVLPGN
jgi:hypothetical protein